MKKYLPLYYKWIEKGRLPIGGLCHSLPSYKDLSVFRDDNFFMGGYWAWWYEFSETPIYTQNVDGKTAHKIAFEFNPLRQNIVLLLAALNGEL